MTLLTVELNEIITGILALSILAMTAMSCFDIFHSEKKKRRGSVQVQEYVKRYKTYT